MTHFFVRNIETDEVVKVLPHSAGDTTDSPEIPDTAFGFARAEYAGTEKWNDPAEFWFDNANKDGAFAQPESGALDITAHWDFVVEETED